MSKIEVCGTVNEKQPKTFSLDNILNVDTATYCESVGKKVGDYTLVPVRSRLKTNFGTETEIGRCPPDIMETLARSVPDGTEKVTEYREAIAANNYVTLQYATGTALVPK